MSLPNYIINLDELAALVAKAMKERTLEYRGNMGCKGLKYNPEHGRASLVWKPKEDILLTGIKVDYSDKRNMGHPYASSYTVLIDGVTIVDEYNITENEDYIRFRQPTPVNKNVRIEILINGKKPKVEIAFGIEFVFYGEDAPPTKIKIKCVDETLDESHSYYLIRESNLFIKGNVTRTIEAPIIDGYEVTGEADKDIYITFTESLIVVEFTYKPVAKTIIVSHVSTTGMTLKQEEFIAEPPAVKTLYAAEIEGYKLIEEGVRTISVPSWAKGAIHEVFLYEATIKNITIECVNIAHGGIILTRRRVVDILPSTITIPAPDLAGYELQGEPTQELYLKEDSPLEATIRFYYVRVGYENSQDIGHDYDIKVVMRWEDNTPIDMDLHLTLNNSPETEVFYGNKHYSTADGSMWLDYDYTSHGNGDYAAKPEIGTVLGFDNKTLNIHVNKFTGGGELKDDVELFVYEAIGKSDRLLAKFNIDSNRINEGNRFCHVADVRIRAGRVVEKMEYS